HFHLKVAFARGRAQTRDGWRGAVVPTTLRGISKGRLFDLRKFHAKIESEARGIRLCFECFSLCWQWASVLRRVISGPCCYAVSCSMRRTRRTAYRYWFTNCKSDVGERRQRSLRKSLTTPSWILLTKVIIIPS